mmetsp:Transcript_27861/g.66189  ORF Transcript_27861/g.66189 Transcript_27861/m.66189 type:complete len:133 (+) Transcript_27861:2075-2473(+)
MIQQPIEIGTVAIIQVQLLIVCTIVPLPAPDGEPVEMVEFQPRELPNGEFTDSLKITITEGIDLGGGILSYSGSGFSDSIRYNRPHEMRATTSYVGTELLTVTSKEFTTVKIPAPTNLQCNTPVTVQQAAPP